MPSPLERLQEMLDEALAAPAQPDPGKEVAHPRALDPRLHAYQRQAIAHLHANPRAGLMLEMGL